MDLRLPDILAAKAASFPESSYGATTVTLVLADGRRVPHVVLAGGTDIVKVGGHTITTRDQLGFSLADIHDVLPEEKKQKGCSIVAITVIVTAILTIVIMWIA
jgi:hypothetical protein